MTVDPYEEERQRSLEEYERQERRERVFRVSERDRERAVEQLRHHLSHGRIDVDEFSERMGLVYEAKTNLDIDRALDQLPFVSIEPSILSSDTEPELGQLMSLGGGGEQRRSPSSRHAAAYAFASGAAFLVMALYALVNGQGVLLLLMLSMAAWGAWVFLRSATGPDR